MEPLPAAQVVNPNVTVVSAPITPSVQPVYAGFGRRLVASLIDGLLVGVVTFIIALPVNIFIQILAGASSMGYSRNGQFGATVFAGLLSLGIELILWALNIIYYVYFIGSRGQTVGKMAMSIKVVKLETGTPPGFAGAILREVLGKIISSIPLGLGYFWMHWDDKKQTWHDKIAGTIVVRT